jgi:hypothetical protein
MTVAAAYLTSEGVVFGADSATTVAQQQVLGQSAVVQLFDHAQKIFEVGKVCEGRLAICTFGAGQVGGASHRTLAARLADWVTEQTMVAHAAQELCTLVQQELTKKALPTSLGYFIGGWNPISHNPECFELAFEPGKPPVVTALQIGEARFQGSPEMFMRAYHGIDPRLPDLVHNELLKLITPPPANFTAHVQTAFRNALAQIPTGGFNDMPLREAIDFIHMYMHLTIKAFKFRFGPPVVGGPIEIGFISTDRNFRWVRHKPFDSAILEEEMPLQ